MELHHKILGSGEPVVILHGLFGMLDNWQTIAKSLAENYMVILIDQRNHGRSPHLSEAFDYKTLARDLKEFLEANWIFEAHIVGHSMGGKTAMEFALTYPDMVNSLTVIDIAPKSYSGGHELVFEALRSVDLKAVKEREEVQHKLAEKLNQDMGTVYFLMKNLQRDPATGGFAWKMNLDAIQISYPAILGNIEGEEPYTGRTLFVKGKRSDYILEEEFESYKQYFPKAELFTIPDAGHWVHADQPQKTIDTLRDWLGGRK